MTARVSLPARLLRQNLKESSITGAGGRELRKLGLVSAKRPLKV